MVVAAILATLAASDGVAARNVPSVLGVILSVAFLITSVTQRAPHFLALAAVALALGTVFGSTVGGWSTANWLLVAIGAATTAVGAIRLALFLLRHPRPQPSEP
jgi:hypothetical protein